MTRAKGETGQGGPPVLGDGRAVKAAAYAALLLLGAVQALIGTFQYSRGPAGLVAICFALAILATCLLGAWGMHSAAGGVLPAAGWLVVSLILGSSSSGGSVLVANTTAGKLFLFGGAICAAAGALIGFARWSHASVARRSGRVRSRPDRKPGQQGPRRL